ncbi:MAG: PCMD domain-containing protein, partial [Bacteroidales bacterium]|nr:PCMD domain-containing protein [Bacteroidales bacterium]
DKGRSGADDDFAPKMVSDEMTFGTESKHIFLPGVVGTLEVLIQEQSAVFGRPFPSRPSALKGYMKYLPVNGDSASIFVEVYKYNEAAGRRQKLCRVEQIFRDSIKDWTAFELPIKYEIEDEVMPDSITVLFVSSAGYDFDDLFNCKGQVGSTLWVDDVEFVYEGGEQSSIRENAVLAASKLYPNPSFNGIFNLNVQEACRMEVIAVSGQLVMQQNLTAAGAHTVDLSRFAPGFYYIRLSNQDGAAVLKAVRR